MCTGFLLQLLHCKVLARLGLVLKRFHSCKYSSKICTSNSHIPEVVLVVEYTMVL